MFKFLTGAVAAAFLAIPASAAVIDMPFGTAEYYESNGLADLFVTGGSLIDEVDGDFDFDLNLTYDVTDPVGTMFGRFFLFEGTASVLTATVSAVRLNDEGLISVEFSELGDAYASLFDNKLLMTLMFFDIFEGNALAALVDGNAYDVAALIEGISETPAPVPLPAGIVLLGSGIVALVVRRRRA